MFKPRKVLQLCLCIGVLLLCVSCVEDSAVTTFPSGPVTATSPVKSPSVPPMESQVDDIVGTSSEYPTESSAIGSVSYEFLPEIGDVGLEDSALLWDFVNGTIGWHTDVNPGLIKSDTYILRNLSHPEILYVDYYVCNNPGLPGNSQGISIVTLTSEELEGLNGAAQKLSSDRVIRDNDWEMYLLLQLGGSNSGSADPIEACLTYYDSAGIVPEAAKGEHDRTGKRTDCFGVSISVINGEPPDDSYPQGRAPSDNGQGYATDWLRKESYASSLLANLQIDIYDVFWDSWTLQRRYVFVNENNVIGGYVVPIDVDQFAVYSDMYADVGERLILEGGQLRYTLDEGGYQIPDMMGKLVIQ